MSIVALFIAAASIAAEPYIPYPWNITQSDGIELKAQLPEPGLTLTTKDPERPKLWYAPVASLTHNGKTSLWYQRVNSGEKEWIDQRTLCLGYIEDGQWSLPSLSPAPPVWGGPNNVVMTRSPHKPTWGGFNVFQMVQDDDRLHMLYWDQPSETGEAGAMIATSTDNGLTWSKDPAGAVFTEHNDAYSLIKNNSGYTLYQTMLEDWPDKPYPDNLDKYKRVIALRTSSNLHAWTSQNVILRPDEKDPKETEFYLMKVFSYGEGLAGLIMKYYADPAMPKKHSAILKYELVLSKDGVAWERPFRDTDVGFWSYADPFFVGNDVHFAMWKDGGMVTVKYRPNHLFGATASARGSLTTSTLTSDFAKATMAVSDPHAVKAITLLDADGHAIAHAKLKWSITNGEIETKVAGKIARKGFQLKIDLENGTLYNITPMVKSNHERAGHRTASAIRHVPGTQAPAGHHGGKKPRPSHP